LTKTGFSIFSITVSDTPKNCITFWLINQCLPWFYSTPPCDPPRHLTDEESAPDCLRWRRIDGSGARGGNQNRLPRQAGMHYRSAIKSHFLDAGQKKNKEQVQRWRSGKHGRCSRNGISGLHSHNDTALGWV